MGVTVKIPTQLRSVTGGEGETTVDGAATVGEVLDGLYDRFEGLRDRIAEDGDLRRFVNVYVGGEGETTVDGAATVGEVLDGLYDRFEGLRDRIAEDGDLRRFVNVYVGGEDIRFLDGLDTSVEDGDEVTILPAVAGGS